MKSELLKELLQKSLNTIKDKRLLIGVRNCYLIDDKGAFQRCFWIKETYYWGDTKEFKYVWLGSYQEWPLVGKHWKRCYKILCLTLQSSRGFRSLSWNTW